MEKKVAPTPTEKFWADLQVRRQFIETELRQLGESLKKRQVHAVIARREPKLIDNVLREFKIIDGERRWRAAKLVGIPTLDAIIVEGDVSPAETKAIQLVTAIHRESLTGAELWEGTTEWLALHPGFTQKQAAEELGVSEASITMYVSGSKVLPEFQEMLRQEKISLKQVYHLSRMSREEQRKVLAEGLEKLTAENFARRVRKQSSREPSGARMTRLALPLPDGRTVTVSGKAVSLAEAIDAMSEMLKAMRKAEADGIDAKTFAAVCRDKAKGNGAA
jgi:ParB family chromosome partitioning protein